MDTTYDKYLINAINNHQFEEIYPQELTINLFLTLLALNNNNYDQTLYNNQIYVLEDYLRKVNNLKVKIQLKRKETEITNLINDIKNIYSKNSELIESYNTGNFNIIGIIDSHDDKQLTTLIDTETKEKMRRQNNQDNYKHIRELFVNNIFSSFNLINDVIYFDNFEISLNDFYIAFSYLLNIDSYRQTNTLSIISSLINAITNKRINNNAFYETIIPLALTHIMSKDNYDYSDIDTSKFSIDNIKITDLYSLAGNNSNPDRCPKWRRIVIPNDYLYDKIKNIVAHGTYYFTDKTFILESIASNISEFKISINPEDMMNFLKDNLNTILTSKQELIR